MPTNALFQVGTRSKSDDATRFDDDYLTCPWIAARTRGLGTHFKCSEVGDFHVRSVDEFLRYDAEKGIHHLNGFALVQADLFTKQVAQSRLSQRLGTKVFNFNFHELMVNRKARCRSAQEARDETRSCRIAIDP